MYFRHCNGASYKHVSRAVERSMASAYRMWGSVAPRTAAGPPLVRYLTGATAEHPVYDAIVAGGGMVGSAMACALGTHREFEGKHILLLEAGPRRVVDSLPQVHSNRVSTLSPASKQLLSAVGAWERIEAMRAWPVNRMQVWDGVSGSMIKFQSNEEKEWNMAHVVENNVTVTALTHCLEQSVRDRVRVLYNTSITDLQLPSHTTESGAVPLTSITLNNGQQLYTRLLVAADGFYSLIRRASALNYITWDYEQTAIVATLLLEEGDNNNVAWQRFLPSGPIAMLPLSARSSSLTWMNPPDRTAQLMAMTESDFTQAVNSAFVDMYQCSDVVTMPVQLLNSFITNITSESCSVEQLPPRVSTVDPPSRATFPLALGHCVHYVKPRLAIVGDAAHRVHPLAGQGVNLGFGDVACLINHLQDVVREGKDFGSITHLLRYETERQRHNAPTMALCDGLHRLYTTERAPIVLMRSLGLSLINALNPIKARLMRHAAV